MRKSKGFFRPGMGSRFDDTWRYRRQAMAGFIMKYAAISIPAYDVSRIEKEIADGLESIEVIEEASGLKYVAPAAKALKSGYPIVKPEWKESRQYFIPIDLFSVLRGG